jgi:hypothetical protein
MNMKTLIIYNSLDLDLMFHIIEGDFSRFNGIVFNVNGEHPHYRECLQWLYTDTGDLNFLFSTDVSVVENKQWDKVAHITWIP